MKNEWQQRPRTAPFVILIQFSAERRQAVVRAFVTSGPPALDGQSPTSVIWDASVQLIVEGTTLGGHQPPECHINRQLGMLFEYRTAPVAQYPYAFWQPGEWSTDTF